MDLFLYYRGIDIESIILPSRKRTRGESLPRFVFRDLCSVLISTQSRLSYLVNT